MLKLIRNNVQSFGVKFVVGIVSVVMLGFGVTTYRSQGINTLVTIDDYEIKLEKYQRALRRAEQAVKTRYRDMADEYMKMINIKQQTLSQLAAGVMILKSAEANGMAVSDEELAWEIRRYEPFVTDGRFDKAKYEDTLKNSGADKLVYEKEFREDLLTRKLFRFLNSDQLLSLKSLRAEYSLLNARMEIKAIEIPPEIFADSLKLSEKDIKDYYNARKMDFMQSPRVVVNYFTLDLDDAKSKTVVRDKETQQYYQNNEKSFTHKESFLVRQILIAVPDDGDLRKMKAARKKAEKIHKRLLKNRKSFASLSRKYSSDPLSANKGGNMGWLEKGEFPLTEKFGEVAGKLGKNEISEPFLTDRGYRIIEVSDIKPAYLEPLENVRKEIEDKIRVKKAKRRLKNKIAGLSKNIDSRSLAAIADSLGKKIVKSPPFDEAGDLAPNIKSPRLYYVLKSKKAKDKGHFTLSEEDKIIVYEVENITEPKPKPLKEVRDDILILAEKEKLSKITENKIKRYSSEIKSQDAFNKLASKLKQKPSRIEFRLSDLEIPPINAGQVFKAEVFRMKPKQFKVISENGRHFLVFLVDKKKAPINDEDEGNIEALKNQIKQRKAQTLLYALISETEKKVDVEYNKSLLEALEIK